jgi:UDP-glucose 4-epimerase
MTLGFKKACVTGGAGFIGSHLVRALLSRDLTVTVLDNLSVGRATNVPAGATLVECDILDAQRVRQIIADCDIVFHLAARVAIRSSFEFVLEDTMINVVGAASVLKAAQRAGSVRKVITASSMAVYADAVAPELIDENHPITPISPYGISKLAAERLTHTMCAQAGMQSAVLRLFNTYGPGQTLSPYVGVVTIFVNALHNGENPTVFGDGEQCRDFVHVEDVVSGFVRAMNANISGETFNIGTGVPVSVNAVLRSLNRVMQTAYTGQHVNAVPGELRYSVADIRKARNVLGYEPVHRFDSSIETVVREIVGDLSP